MKKLLLVLLVLFALAADGVYANNYIFSAPTTVTVTSASALIKAKNGLRNYLLIQNQSTTVPVIVKFGSIQSASEGVVIPPGGNYEPFNAPANGVYAKTSSSTAVVVIQEGQ